MRKTSQIDNTSELIPDDVSRKQRNADEVSVGGRLSDYLLPCHHYGDNHPNQREFEGNAVALMAHTFTSLSLVDHDCFRKLTQDLGPRLHPVGRSKLSQSLKPTEKQLAEKSDIESMAKVKALVISYDLWMSRKTEEIFSLTEHYCIVPDK